MRYDKYGGSSAIKVIEISSNFDVAQNELLVDLKQLSELL
jgi:hypothetical protein